MEFMIKHFYIFSRIIYVIRYNYFIEQEGQMLIKK